ncbi:MAG: hypothetical protein NTW20_14815 [Rhodobacterales bacterium]|nr:hypothetical protein [Rhodobacterales bacterium]
MKTALIIPSLVLALSGCAVLQKDGVASVTGPAEAQPATEMVAAAATTALGARAVSAESLDTTTPAERQAALAAPASGAESQLGRVVVALGPPAEQGLWLSSALVTAAAQGRIETATGQSLVLELRPGKGGALLSLAAFQALGLSLTDLPEVTVFAQ